MFDRNTRFHLFRIRLNKQGYDNQGAYYGLGLYLYYARNNIKTTGKYFEREFRAKDRTNAKEIILKEFPSATFYN